MTVINSVGKNGMTVSDPADQYLVKDTAISTITISPSGGTAPYTVSVYLGTLPTGLSIGSPGSTVDITGTPTAQKTAENLIFLIVDDDGGAIITGPVLFAVADDFEISGGLDSATTINATKSTAFSYQLYTTGGRTPVTWAKTTGTWPAGLSISSAGLISGTPTAVESQALTFTATDANSETATTASITIEVNDVLSITQAAFTVYEDTPTAHSIVADDGSEPINFAIDDDDVLPEGLILIQDGIRTMVLVGTVPSGASNETINITATDANGDTDTTGDILLTVDAVPVGP